MDEILKTKKSVSVFAPTSDCPLKATDLLNYCYRAFQEHYSTVPKNRRVAKAVGLRETTISNSTGRLQEFGLLNKQREVILPMPRLEWFRILDSLREMYKDRSETLWFQNWKCLIRQPGQENPLKFSSVVLYSLIRHSRLNNWKPSGGWSKEYLATATGLDPKTVTASLQILEQHGFLEVLDGFRFRLFRLSEGQLACFADKGISSPNSADPDEICDHVSPASKMLDASYEARKKLTAEVDTWPLSESEKQAIIIKTMKQDNWHENWSKIADHFITKQMERHSGLR